MRRQFKAFYGIPISWW